MWIRKGERDRRKGIDTAIPTQIVSNEEFMPRRQNVLQKEWEARAQQAGDENAKKIGMDRRAYMASSMGIAACLAAQNEVYGKVWDVEPEEVFEPQAVAERFPKSEYFIIDVQSHFTSGAALNFRNSETAKNMGFDLKNDSEAYSFKTFTKEMYLDSETAMVVISGVPTKENQRAPDGRVLQGRERAPPPNILPSWLMAEKRTELNELAGSQRALAQGNLAPNHYWDAANKRVDRAATIEQMERELELYKIDSWKWYCHTDPGRSGGGFQLNDDNSQWFIEESRKRGMKLISCHKGYSYQSRTLGHLANPQDVGEAAMRNPDFNFVIYHSALKHGQADGENWHEMNEWNPETGDFLWHKILMEQKIKNPTMNNVYCEIGSFFNTLVVADPIMCMHGIGKNIKHYGADHVIWGTDCLWWGSPQWAIEAFQRFQISDELCEKHGYKKLTKQDKAQIFGLNAAKLYKVDVNAQRKALPADVLSRVKTAYNERGGMRSNEAQGWVRADV